MTLLFFFERLLDKGGPRTLHDLSCQFGAKGFTKEMRQIAGGSQSGLKKFLTQYPYLFTVNGDHVHVNSFNNVSSDADGSEGGTSAMAGKRDYVKEAVEYFVDKLLQYGKGTEVPIKSLLGHRSQAPPEVRHISGQRANEFHDFLCRYPDVFIVREDTVMLKEFEGYEPQPFHEIEEVQVDVAARDRLLDFLGQTIEEKGPTLVDHLFQSVVQSFSEEDYHSIFKTPQDLLTFLKLYSNTFHVQSNMVNLASPRPKPSEVSRAMRVEPSKLLIGPNQASNNISITSANNDQSQPVSNVPLNQNTPNVQNQSLKQWFNSLVIKTLADNAEKDEKDRSLVVGGAPAGTPYSNANGMSQQSVESYKLRVFQSTRVIVSVKDCLQVVEDIFARVKPGGPTVAVSFDCEGVNLGARGKLTSFQLGLMTGQAFIFDLVTCPKLVTEGGLQRLLESKDIVKVRSFYLTTNFLLKPKSLTNIFFFLFLFFLKGIFWPFKNKEFFFTLFFRFSPFPPFLTLF